VPGIGAGAPTPAGTATAPADPNELRRPPSLDERPGLRHRTGREVRRTADRVPEVVEERARFERTTSDVFTKGASRWQVSYYAPREDGDGRREIAQVIVDDASGAVLETWTGHHVAWTMARGYPGAFGRKVGALWIWIPMCVLFVAPFVRRPLRMVHLDLLVLLSFSASFAFFNHADIDVSVPLVYPPLVYLLLRLLAVGLRRPRAPERPLPLLVPVTWLAVGAVFLLGFRVGLNVASSNVIDVGYSGVIGADRIADGTPLYGDWPRDNQHGDTYGPFNYLAYVPFEQALPWSGRWDDLPAAHVAALTFDLLCVVALFLLGRRIRGAPMGIVLAYAWLAFPFTLFATNTNSNDALPAALVLFAVLAASRPVVRGTLAGLAAMTKFAPLGLVPLLALHGGGPARARARRAVLFAVPFAAVCAALLWWLAGDLRLFWDRTVGFQTSRGAPFSIWGLWELEAAQRVVQGAVTLLALGVAFVRRREDLVGLAALCGAVLVALQLGLTYWFYLYVVWFAGLALVALLARHDLPARS
jgi:hypothetical protein